MGNGEFEQSSGYRVTVDDLTNKYHITVLKITLEIYASRYSAFRTPHSALNS